MSNIFVNGAEYSISSGLAAASAISAISNAKPAVASAAAPPADGAIVVIKSGWSSLDETVSRTTGATADSFALDGVDTSNLIRFQAGNGAGSFQTVTDWIELNQVRTVAMSGGEQQFYQYQYVEDADSRQRQKPTFKNARVLTMTLDYDPSKAWYQGLIDADSLQEPVVINTVLPSGATILYYAYPSFDKVPTQALNEAMQNTATFSLIADPIRYEAAA